MNTVRWWEIINGWTKIYSLKRELCRPSHKIHLVQAHFSIRWVVWKLCMFLLSTTSVMWKMNVWVGALMCVGVCDCWIWIAGITKKIRLIVELMQKGKEFPALAKSHTLTPSTCEDNDPDHCVGSQTTMSQFVIASSSSTT